MGANVTILDKNIDRLRWVDDLKNGRITTLASNRGALEQAVQAADAVIGAVLVPGGRAPVVVTEDMVKTMKPGSVLLDVAVDQGGCIETTKETTHTAPTFVVHSVVHYAVGNMPGAVPRTSAYALSNATLPYVLLLATHGTKHALSLNSSLIPGLTTVDGRFVNADVAASLGVEPFALTAALDAL
jgi:alanine dehydrogenase